MVAEVGPLFHRWVCPKHQVVYFWVRNKKKNFEKKYLRGGGYFFSFFQDSLLLFSKFLFNPGKYVFFDSKYYNEKKSWKKSRFLARKGTFLKKYSISREFFLLKSFDRHFLSPLKISNQKNYLMRSCKRFKIENGPFLMI